MKDNEDLKLFMILPQINVYSAALIMAEIGDVSRFGTKEKLAPHAGLVPRQ
ncbi:MAG: IS110 family transposase [Candidatus Thermoplasmatota archaeon]|nr:IS110 family transposase [Candidatus Thermoplasmatota archaeon]